MFGQSFCECTCFESTRNQAVSYCKCDETTSLSPISFRKTQSIVEPRDSLSPIILSRPNFNGNINIRTDTPSITTTRQISTQNDPSKNTEFFSSIYMKSMVELISLRYKSDFELPSEYNVNTTIVSCSCCLCMQSRRSGDLFEFCIKKHPVPNKSCLRDKQPRRNSSPRKYQKQHICTECMYSMTANSKKKLRRFRCVFGSCSEKLGSLSALRKHYLAHFRVKKNFVCQFCDKDYATLCGLKNHERSH